MTGFGGVLKPHPEPVKGRGLAGLAFAVVMDGQARHVEPWVYRAVNVSRDGAASFDKLRMRRDSIRRQA